MKVLIVEDDQTTRQFYEKVAKTLDLEPYAFPDAESAWIAYENESFPIVILDWLLPGMNGLQLCQQMRAHSLGQWSVILVATVKNHTNDLREVLKAGADDYITKPLDIEHLQIRLEIAKNNAQKLMEKQKTDGQLQELRDQMLIAERLVSVRGMVSGVSHELNNPLQGILGMSQVLVVEAKDQGIKADIEEIIQLANQCKTIIHDLLIFSEGEEKNKEIVDMHQALERFLNIWKKKMVSENVHVIKKFDSEAAPVNGNMSRINQVLFHLFQNAVQAMPQGGLIIIETKVDKSDVQNYLEMKFKDTGQGIAADQIKQVFDPFFTTREVGEGKGLGLSVCHGIIREYGGQVKIQSEGLGKGTVVTVRLPLVSLNESKV
ncbi:MAG: ATP-binding protein [Elusimicrobiota bacterium]